MPRRYNLSFAGQNFGFELPQVTDESGNTQTESVLADYFPELKLTYAPKGSRGGRLGRSTDQTTSEISLKQREAANAGAIGGNVPTNITVNVPQTPAAAPTPTPATLPVPEVKKDTRAPISYEYGQSADYFGGVDYWRNIEKGYTPSEIKSYLDAHPNLLRDSNVKGGGGLYDQIVAGKVDLPNSASQPAAATPTPAPAPAPKQTWSDPNQTQEFKSAPSSSPSQSSSRAPISAEYGISPDYFGGEDLKAAQQAGYSNAEIRQFLDQHLNLLRGGNTPGQAGGVYDLVSQ
jgi:hypothetical protein